MLSCVQHQQCYARATVLNWQIQQMSVLFQGVKSAWPCMCVFMDTKGHRSGKEPTHEIIYAQEIWVRDVLGPGQAQVPAPTLLGRCFTSPKRP